MDRTPSEDDLTDEEMTPGEYYGDYLYDVDGMDQENEDEGGNNGGLLSEPGTSDSSSYNSDDPEAFTYQCLQIVDVERLLNESVQALCAKIPVTPALAKVLLHYHNWDVNKLEKEYREDCHRLLVKTHLKPPAPVPTSKKPSYCPVCARQLPCSDFRGLGCGHQFCNSCWIQHCESQLNMGVSTGIECMDTACRLLAPQDFLQNILTSRSDLRVKYQRFVFQDHVKSHKQLRFCPGPDCSTVVKCAKLPEAKKVKCTTCSIQFCFKCGLDYHAPTSCEWIRRWLMKCADDSETANYITANTKDCPNCHSCIEKNGGCNHMQCTKCKHHFCWMCLQDWKQHGSEYYECSRYKENPAIVNETVHVKARAALEKYLFYFERWENHAKSLKMEEALFEKIGNRVNERVGEGEGTWIDWQFLYEAARLLTRSRYTLQYTYPYAYYTQTGTSKELFEYQQAQLEKEIEELSWKVERAETSDHGQMERQMHVIEQKRRTLLKDFL